MQDPVELLGGIDLFNGLTPEQVRRLAALCMAREFQADDVIFEQGGLDRDLFILAEGRVRIVVPLDKIGSDATVHIVKPGHVFGEFALVDGQPRSAAAVAVKPGRVFVLGRQELESLMTDDLEIGYILMRNMAATLCRRIRKTTNELSASLMWDNL